MRRFFTVFFLICLCAAVFAQTDATSRKRYALVIGNQNYSYSPLKTNIADAEMVSSALSDKEFDVTFKKDLNGSEMKEAVESFISKVNADSRSVALVYFTGHAFTKDEENYLLPVDNAGFSSEEEAKAGGLDLQKDIADKIKTNAQIYVVDGAYENPFKLSNARALGVKGSLSAARSVRESTVGFLFSASPDQTVSESSGKNSAFASAFTEEINKSSSSLAVVFSDVKESVKNLTKDEQVPYSSATSLDFAFNGDELTALRKVKAIEASDTASLASYEMNKSYEAENSELLIQKSLLAKNSEAEVQRLTQEAQARRAAQQESDRKRAEEEALAAKNRSAEDNAAIDSMRKEFEESAAALKNSMQKDSSAEERIESIEETKLNLHTLRETAQAQFDAANDVVNESRNARIQEIKDKPVSMVEDDGFGGLNAKGQEFRNKRIAEVNAECDVSILANKKERDDKIAQDDAYWLPQLKSAYSKLEGAAYTVTSLSDSLTVRVGNYDGTTATWNLNVTSELFGYTSLFEEDIPLSFTDVTGKKNTDIAKMTDAEMNAYNDEVELYDALFRSATPVFYVNLTYKLLRWRNASEYHFVPVKCEIIRIGKKNKVIKKVTQGFLSPENFVMYPQVEIRTDEEIIKDKTRASKKLDAEQKKYDKAHGIKKTEAVPETVKTTKYSGKKAGADTKPLKGRNALFITCDYASSDVFENDYFKGLSFDKPSMFDWQLHLDFNLAKYYFWGLGFGMQYWDFGNYENSLTKAQKKDFHSTVLTASWMNGFDVVLFNHFRPYVEGGLSFSWSPFNPFDYNTSSTADEDLAPGSDKVLGLHFGGGFDVILQKHLMINAGINYGWMHYLKSFAEGAVSKTDGSVDVEGGFWKAIVTPDYRQLEFSIGLGLTW